VRKGLKGIRDQVVIVSKIAHWGNRTGQGVPKTTVDMIRLCGHASIGRLGVDAIDVMLCHEENFRIRKFTLKDSARCRRKDLSANMAYPQQS
jgi:aryl-alcohol dehydrogenase-like predicted oxidoreductase